MDLVLLLALDSNCLHFWVYSFRKVNERQRAILEEFEEEEIAREEESSKSTWWETEPYTSIDTPCNTSKLELWIIDAFMVFWFNS